MYFVFFSSVNVNINIHICGTAVIRAVNTSFLEMSWYCPVSITDPRLRSIDSTCHRTYSNISYSSVQLALLIKLQQAKTDFLNFMTLWSRPLTQIQTWVGSTGLVYQVLGRVGSEKMDPRSCLLWTLGRQKLVGLSSSSVPSSVYD